MLTFEESTELENLGRAYAGRRILITGAGGFLGGALAEALSFVDCRLVCLSSRNLEPAKGKNAKISVEKAEYGSPEFWTRVLPGADYIFHFAGQTSAVESEANPGEDFRANVLPISVLLEVCRKNKWKPAVLFAGTVTQTGIPERLPVDETMPSNPMTVYDAHKQMAEDSLKSFSRFDGIRGVCLRLANVYGPGREVSRPDRSVLNQMMRRALDGKSLTVYGDGRQLRDYLFITDAVRAFLAAGQSAERLAGRHFVIGSGRGTTISEAFETIADCAAGLTGVRPAVEFTAAPSGRPVVDARDFTANIGAFSALTGWRPLTDFREGVERSLRTWLAGS